MSKKIYDKSGKWVGTETKDWLGNDVIKDRDGKVQNYLGKDALGNSVVRDRDGKIQARLGEDFLGNQVMRDRDGKTTGYLGTKDALGNNVFRNADGKVTGYYDRGGDGSGGFFGTGSSSSGIGGSSGYSGNTSSSYGTGSYQDPYDASFYEAMERAYNAPVHLTPQQKRKAQKYESLGNWGFAFFGLPIIYLFARLFLHSLPMSFTAMVLVLVAGSFIGEFFLFASDTAFEFTGLFVAVGVVSLAYILQIVCMPAFWPEWENDVLYRLFYEAEGIKGLYLAGPILFLIADILGTVFGKRYEKHLRKKMLAQNASMKLTVMELIGKFISVWLSAFFGMLVTAAVMVVWFVVLRWAIIRLLANILVRILPPAAAFFNNPFAVSALIALIGTAILMPIGKKFVESSSKIYQPKHGARYIAIAVFSLLLACFFYTGWRHGDLPITLTSLQSRVQEGAWFCAAYGMIVYACKFIAAAIRLHNGGKLWKKSAKKK